MVTGLAGPRRGDPAVREVMNRRAGVTPPRAVVAKPQEVY